jgi:two-component system response regulator YesN
MKLRVLVADDEERIREGMIRQIGSMDLELEVAGSASDGQEALALVGKLVPDIVVMDINMPFMDGLECIARIRAMDPFCSIIIVSGYDRFEYAKRALELGVDRYLLKPVDDGEFEEAFRHAARKHAERLRGFSAEKSIAERGNNPEAIVSYIKEHFAENGLSSESLEAAFSMSRSALFKAVKGATGLGVSDYISALRIECARALLLDQRRLSIKEICGAVGYEDQHCFSKAFKRHTGLSPLAYRTEHAQKDTSRKH